MYFTLFCSCRYKQGRGDVLPSQTDRGSWCCQAVFTRGPVLCGLVTVSSFHAVLTLTACVYRRSSPRMASSSRESGSSRIQLPAPSWPLMTLAGTPVSVRRSSPVRLLRCRRPVEVTSGQSVTHRHTYRLGRPQQPATDRTHLQVRNGNTLQMVCNPPHCLST